MSGALVNISHFAAMVIFAALISIALGCLTQRTTMRKIKYALWSFVLFMVAGVGIAWLMYPFSR
ncbi:MAG: hypothetical protein ACRD4Q_04950 [Candidatus Acidiferrales bacterium]